MTIQKGCRFHLHGIPPDAPVITADVGLIITGALQPVQLNVRPALFATISDRQVVRVRRVARE